MKRVRPLILGAAVVIASLVAVLLLAGCGSAQATPDPFLGTWRPQTPSGKPPGSPPMIITRAQAGYLVTVVYWGPGQEPASPRPTLAIPFTRHGDTLAGAYKVPGMGRLRAEIAYLPRSGQLAWANSSTPSGPLGKPVKWVKVSGGTAYPTTP